jgi:hypothetical protein
MNEIEINIHLAEGGHSKVIKIAEDATIGQLLEKAQAAGAAIGEPGEEIILWVENKEIACHKHQKIHESGIKHGHHLHFHHREVVIIVNTRDEKWGKPEISYGEVVKLAFPNQSLDPKDVYSVTFSKGPEHKREGTLVAGQSVKVKSGMIFNVKHTYRS